MRPTFIIPAAFQLAVTVLLAIIPIISATPSPLPELAGGPPPPVIVQQFDKWDYIGCIPDSNFGRTLSTQITGGLNTVEYCLEACKDGKFAYAGMEFGSECWCGNTIEYGRTKINPDYYCIWACPGNRAQMCGGLHCLTMYSYTGVYPNG